MSRLINPYSGEELPEIPAFPVFSTLPLPDPKLKVLQMQQQIWVLPSEKADEIQRLYKFYFGLSLSLGIMAPLLMLAAYIHHYGMSWIVAPLLIVFAINVPLERMIFGKIAALKASGKLAGTNTAFNRLSIFKKIFNDMAHDIILRFTRRAMYAGWAGIAVSLLYLLVNLLKMMGQPPNVATMLLCLLLVATAYLSSHLARIASKKLQELKRS